MVIEEKTKKLAAEAWQLAKQQGSVLLSSLGWGPYQAEAIGVCIQPFESLHLVSSLSHLHL